MSNETTTVVVANPWAQLRQYTPARIALGRAGVSLPTAPHLAFQLAHARARDAVHHELDAEKLRVALALPGRDVVVLHSAAASRLEYLQRPDKGRRLDLASRAALQQYAEASPGSCDIVFVIGDGLSAHAIEENAAGFLDRIVPRLEGWRLAPLVIVKEARVAVGDEIGEVLDAGIVAILIGERPGLSSPDSMGIYMTYKPRVGLTDEARNCISNIRSEGLSHDAAAHKLHYLLSEARRRELSGVHLKDESEAAVYLPARRSENFLTEGE